ncbi:3-oxoacyl-ACP reductase [Clostridia bacterium]|nr:3-oxoacyl-ACP reductase [Clostridia bacterium]
MTAMTGKTALITGASGGIGLAMAEAFAIAGYQVLAGYHTHPEPIGRLARRLAGLSIAPVRADVSKAADVERLFAGVNADVLINNAGISQTRLFTDITEDDWDNMLAVNLKSAYLCAKQALPHMLREKSGCIINISSVWGVTGGSCEVHYSAAKAGMIGLTKALAKELGPSGIRVNCIAPGVIETAMLDGLTADDRAVLKEQTPLGKIGLPEEIAKAALFLAESGFVTGEVMNINGGLYI